MGGANITDIISNDWRDCSGCYANAVTNGVYGSHYNGVNLGTEGAQTVGAVDIRAGGKVVMAGNNSTTGGWGGVSIYSGSKIYGDSVAIYGTSTGKPGMQVGYGSDEQVDFRATTKVLIAGQSSAFDFYGIGLIGTNFEAPTGEFIGVNVNPLTNDTCRSCAGITFGDYSSSLYETHINTNLLITPHIAGATIESQEKAFNIAFEFILKNS
jgi:hypothetical protein